MTTAPAREWICQRIVEEAPLAMIFADRDGAIRLWNAGAEAMFGYQAGEVLGQTMDFIIPERHRARHWEGYRRTMATGITKYGHQVLAVPAIVKGGGRISIEFNIALLRAPTGEILGAAAMIQDVTARWERDKALRERLSAAEAKLKEIMSNLKPEAARQK
jgi:PAS domain S-box-containing protein